MFHVLLRAILGDSNWMNELDCGDLVPIRMILTLAACKGQNKRMTDQLVLISAILDGLSTFLRFLLLRILVLLAALDASVESLATQNNSGSLTATADSEVCSPQKMQMILTLTLFCAQPTC